VPLGDVRTAICASDALPWQGSVSDPAAAAARTHTDTAMYDSSYFTPSDEEIERERQRRDADSTSPAPIPLPATVPELLAVCQRYRNGIVDAMRLGYAFLPDTSENFAAMLVGSRPGVVLTPNVRRVVNAAFVLSMADAAKLLPQLGDGSEPLYAIAVLDAVIAWCGTATVAPAALPKGSRGKGPSKEALACWRLYVLRGQKQAETAEMLSREFHRPIGQPQVSRWIAQVRRWLAAGNVLPDLPTEKGSRPTVSFHDPAGLDSALDPMRVRRRKAKHRPLE
jgi:hypothetical protein